MIGKPPAAIAPPPSQQSTKFSTNVLCSTVEPALPSDSAPPVSDSLRMNCEWKTDNGPSVETAPPVWLEQHPVEFAVNCVLVIPPPFLVQTAPPSPAC